MATQAEILLETGTNELEILEFFVNEPDGAGGVRPCYFGVNVAKVMQVIESPGLTHPESATHPCFLGTIPLRQHILPVIDLAVWLGLARAVSDLDVVIVTEFSQAVTGFLVSGVTEIHRVGWKEVIPPSGLLARSTASIIGIVNKTDRFIQLLDLEHILSALNPRGAEDTWKVTARAGAAHSALVADDSPTIRALLKDNLSRANFRLELVDNGEAALNRLQRIKDQALAEGRPVRDFLEIVISDIEMPLMDGFSLTKTIKHDPVLKDLPVILYSSIITDELRHKGESVRADAQVAKPDLDKMAELAIRILEGQAAAAG